jgi:hypothetical protein
MKFPRLPKIDQQICRQLHGIGALEPTGAEDEWYVTRKGSICFSILLALLWLQRSKPRPTPRPKPPSDGSNVVPIRR